MATKVGSAYFDVTFNTTAARRELTALVSVANRQFGLLGGVAIVGATVAIGAAVQATFQLGSAAVATANEYEHAFARVRKTLDDGTLSAEGSQRAFAALNQELRDIALETPLDLSTEIAAIAALGGQMGIARQDIGEFTQVIGELGVTTTLTVEDAATQFSRLSNIVGLPSTQFRGMADDLVHLGNNFAATEDEILRFSLRIAAAGEIVGFSESDLLALASAMTAVGVPAERGGTAIQRTLIRIQRAVADGSEHLETFGEVSGMSAEEFAQAWREDPARAFQAFIEGVGRSGESAFAILQNTELANERTIQSLLSLANAGDLYGRALDTAAKSSGALAREADIFFDTTTSKLKLLGNTAKDAAITMGEPIQGPLRGLIDGLAEWITSNDVLFMQIGTNLASALEGIAPTVLTIVDHVAALTSAWSDFLAELNTPGGQAWDWLFGEDPEPRGVPSELQEWQDFIQRGILFDPHIANFNDWLPGNADGITQLTIVEEGLRRMIRHGTEGVGEVQKLTSAFVELDQRLEPLGQNITRMGWDELVDELKLTDDQLREVITNLRNAGVDLPREILIEFGLYAAGLPPELTGPGGSSHVVIPPPLSRFELDELMWEDAKEQAEEAAAAAKEFADALDDVQSAASDLNIPAGVLLDNIDRLAPGLAPAVDQFGRAQIEARLFGNALMGLQNVNDFDLSDVTDEFDLLLTTVNKAGDEVPTTVRKMLADLREQAQTLADFEAGISILEMLGFDDLAAEFKTLDPEEALPALKKFVTDLEAAAEAEGILDTGGRMSEGMQEAFAEALANGDITPELMKFVKENFTSTEVRQAVENAANDIDHIWGLALQVALEHRTDIRVPVHLIPEITHGPLPGYDPGTNTSPDPVGPPPASGGGRGSGGVLLQFTSPQVPLTDAARAAQLVRGILT